MYAQVVVAILLVAWSPRAEASPEEGAGLYKPTQAEAVAHYKEGNRLVTHARDEGRPFADRVRDLRAAIVEYEIGARVEDVPAFDYNIGIAATRLGDKAQAVAHFLRFLEKGQPRADLRANVEQQLSKLDPSGELRAQARRSVPDETHQSAAPSAAASAPSVPAQAPAMPAPAPAPAADTASAPTGNPWPWIGWSLTAVGVASGGVAGWLAWSASGLDDDAKDTSRPQLDRVSLQGRADTRRKLAIGFGIGGGVSVIVGVIALLGPARRADHRTSTAWLLTPTGNGVALVGRF
jgi:hypothetical protein